VWALMNHGYSVWDILTGFLNLNLLVLGMGRASSGAFGAVQSTVQVYISDIAKSNEARADLISYASAIPGIALSFGPTIGGALAHYGLNVPVTFDATLTLFSFFFVYLYLPETPKFRAILAARARGEPTDAEKKKDDNLAKKEKQ